MAKQVQTLITDDIGQESGAETVTFAFNGVACEIGLIPKRVEALKKALDPYMTNGRRVRNGLPLSGVKKPGPAPRRDLAGLRAWAKQNDIELPMRGRIPAAIEAQYDEWSATVARRGNGAAPKG